MNGTKEIISYVFEVKNKVDAFIETLISEEEEQKFEEVSISKLEQTLSQNTFSFEVSAQSKTIYSFLNTLIDIKGTNMIISDHGRNKFAIRNR